MKKQRAIIKKAAQPTLEVNLTERKKSLYLGDYYCMKELQSKPVTDGLLELIASKLVEYVEDESNIDLLNFKLILKMGESDYWKWCEKSEKLKKAHEWAKQVLGMRREAMACRRQLDGGMVRHTLHQYHPDFREAAEFHSKLGRRESENISGGTTFVVLPKIESDEQGQVYFEVEK